jgi:2-polyprenyl-3-methyl-5-hydroxy-6-metoxy-1,4-benzoquinol methylase
MRYYCTLFDSNYLSRGLALHKSLLAQSSKDFKLFILPMDQACYESLQKLKLKNVDIISFEDFLSHDLKEAMKNRTWAEFCWTCSSAILEYCFNRFGLHQCTYLDSDIYFYNDPELAFEEFKENSGALITKHNFSIQHDQSRSSGIYCVQFMPFNNNALGREILNDWYSKCLASCELNPAEGKCGDQKYLDEWPEKFKGVVESKEFGLGIAPWNVQKIRKIDRGFVTLDDGQVYKIIFYHFHGLKVFFNSDVKLTGSRYEISDEVKSFFYDEYLDVLTEVNSFLALHEIRNYHGAQPGTVSIPGIKTFLKKILRYCRSFKINNVNHLIKREGIFGFRCIFCQEMNFKIKYYSLFDDRYGFPGSFNLIECLNCGHLHLNSNFKDNDFVELYSNYYPRAEFDLKSFQPLSFKGGVTGFIDGERSSAASWVPRNIKVLDVGCGFGSSVAYHKSRGCVSVGVEADSNINRIKEAFGLDIRIGVFDDKLFTNEKFDFITLDQVLEHSKDPFSFFSTLSARLEDSGQIVLSIPNAHGWGARFFRRRWINWHTPYHLQFFTDKSFQKLSDNFNLRVVKSETITHSNWLYYQILHLLTFPQMGSQSSFWASKPVKQKSKALLVRLVNLSHRFRFFHIVTRLFDLVGMGDNRLIILQKGKKL